MYQGHEILTCIKLCVYVHTLTLLDHYKGVPPPSDIRDAAAAAAVGTTPVETPGLDRWRSLRN
jgi:hypothetical protein